MEMGRIAVAMSGGVDSSTAATILKEAGFDLVGFSMQLWDRRRSGSQRDEFKANRCCSLDDLYDAREVAARLKIPYYVVDFQKQFERTVVQTFIENYRDGLTPSPCVLCNSLMKFHHLLRLAEKVKAARVATGHYARISRDQGNGRYLLLKARDESKDQSYFLFELNQAQLAKAVFPLGDLEKEKVREIARRNHLAIAEKDESQEICFVPDGDYVTFLERHSEEIVESLNPKPFSPGKIVDVEGKKLGSHPGIHCYTIGQRRGLGIAHASPLYVLELRPEDNTVVVGERARLRKHLCRVTKLNWISIPSLMEPLKVQAKIRSRHEAAPAKIFPKKDGSVEVIFEEPQTAITPGQACVFYQGDVVVGGGWISRE
jgi:tRNA-specific 2-thiouridylase